MTFPVNGILDNFNRSNEDVDVSSSWTNDPFNVATPSPQIVSNVVKENTTNNSGSCWWDDFEALNAEAYMTITATSVRTLVIFARLTAAGTSSVDCYAADSDWETSNTDIFISRIDNGVATILGATISTQDEGVGFKLGLSIIGDTIRLYFDSGSGWVLRITRTDATYQEPGFIGFFMRGEDANARIDDFGGGSLDSFPLTPVLTNFTTADENPISEGGDWNGPTFTTQNALQIISNQGAPSGSFDGSYWDTSFSANQECYITLSVANDVLDVSIRLQNPGVAASVDGYSFEKDQVAGDVLFYRYDNDAATQLGPLITQSLGSGDKLGVSMIDDDLTGYVDTGSGWVAVGTRVDATYSGPGYIGIDCETAGTRIDDLGGGGIAPLGDNYMFGSAEQFGGLAIEISTPLISSGTITWEYNHGGVWLPLSGVIDGTNSFKNSGVNKVTWTIPSSWDKDTINSQGPFQYVRAIFSGSAVTQFPKARKVTLDITRYLPFIQNNTVPAAGLATTATWIEDTIAEF